MLIYGINAVAEAIRGGGVTQLRVAERPSPRVLEIIRAAERAGIAVRRVAQADLDRAARGGVHQGVVADAREAGAVDLEDLVAGTSGPPLLLVLDGVEDPQ